MPSAKDIWERLVESDGLWDFKRKDATLPRPRQSDIETCRKLCEQNVCKCYGTTWGCPPGVGSIGKCQMELKSYGNAVILYRRYEADLKDQKALAKISADLQRTVRLYKGALVEAGFSVLALADGGCDYCPSCTYPDAPCRHPDERIPSISGYGVIMVDYLADNGLDMPMEDDHVTVFGLVLYNPPSEKASQ